MASNNSCIVGLHGQESLARTIANRLKAKTVFASIEKYPAGELAVFGPKTAAPHTIVAADVMEDPESVLTLILLADCLRRAGAKKLTLIAPWIAYGRQDKSSAPGNSPAGLVIADLLARSFAKIITLDAHSPAFISAFKNKLKNIQPHAGMISATLKNNVHCIAAPDRGAAHRAEKIAGQLRLPVVIIQKHRQAGKIDSEISATDKKKVAGRNVLIIDDMSDTGGTLIAAAKTLKAADAKNVNAFICHCFDKNLLQTKIQKYITKLEAGYDHSNSLKNSFIISQLTTFSH
ncbi:MAG: ribose-phosphate diphosphokinase [Patescibacteria group bacterium]